MSLREAPKKVRMGVDEFVERRLKGDGGRLAMLFFKYEMNSRTADCSSVVSCETICVRLSASTSHPFQQSIPALGGPQLDEANPAERCVPDTHRLPRAARQC